MTNDYLKEVEDQLAAARAHVAELKVYAGALDTETLRMGQVIVVKNDLIDTLKAEVLRVEAKWAHTVDALRAATERIAELEADAEKVAADERRKLNLVINQREAGRARIAELEAEVHHFKTEYQDTASRAELAARIAELEAQLAGKAVNVADPMEWARQIVLAEREACAITAKEQEMLANHICAMPDNIAAAIRARPTP